MTALSLDGARSVTFARYTAEQLQLSWLSPSMSSLVGGASASSTQQPPVQLQQELLPIAPIIVSCSDSEDDLDLASLAARSVQPQQEPLTLPLTLVDHAHGVVCIESDEQIELLIKANVQQSELSGVQPEPLIVAGQQPVQPQQGVGQVILVLGASCLGPLGLSSSQDKDVLILQVPLIIGCVYGQALVWD